MKRTNIFLLHLCFWLLFAILPLSTIFIGEEPVTLSERIYIITIYSLHVLNFYTGYYILVPFLFLKKRKLYLKVLGTTLLIILFCIFRYLIIRYFYLNLPIEIEAKMLSFFKNPEEVIFVYAVHSFVFTAYAFLMRSTFEWFITQKQKAELINQNQAGELALLRYQLNPHFLFNTLNNIDSLTHTNPEKASAGIIKLSDIMRYVLYETSSNFVELSKEITYLKSFIELNNLRYGDGFIRFDYTMMAQDKMIAPMLLIPLVENAIKHGDKKMGNPSIIISLSGGKEEIQFEVINFVSNEVKHKDIVGGIGLNNLKRRLNLLYPNRHTFETYINDNNQYTVCLCIS
ncbi:MAG: histidine kinase [Bacteroidota bacterium]